MSISGSSPVATAFENSQRSKGTQSCKTKNHHHVKHRGGCRYPPQQQAWDHLEATVLCTRQMRMKNLPSLHRVDWMCRTEKRGQRAVVDGRITDVIVGSQRKEASIGNKSHICAFWTLEHRNWRPSSIALCFFIIWNKVMTLRRLGSLSNKPTGLHFLSIDSTRHAGDDANRECALLREVPKVGSSVSKIMISTPFASTSAQRVRCNAVDIANHL